jgi:hypothetical protein
MARQLAGDDSRPLRGFLSYSVKDKRSAKSIKSTLETFSVNCFLAHEDLEPTIEWGKDILRVLRACDIFMPLLTSRYPDSKWTDQEVGIAVGLKKVVLPVKMGLDPYGFIQRFQAIELREDVASSEFGRRVYDVLLKHTKVGKRMRRAIINAFIESSSFDEARRRSRSLREIIDFEAKELEMLVRGAAGNYQIYDSFGAKDVVRMLISRHKEKISSGAASDFLHAAGCR